MSSSTCHKAQGATVEVALVYGTSALTREAGYVALSRGRTANHLYIATDQPQRADTVRGPYLGPVDLDRVAARFFVHRSQRLALEQLPEPPARTRPTWQHQHVIHQLTYPAPDRYGGISR